MRPNIFNYATSELSQDAVICWMLEWANIKDNMMRDFAFDFIREILNLHKYNFVELDNLVEVKIRKQYNNIDILIYLVFKDGEILPLIIEDKTYTTEHSDQLKRYYDLILKENQENKKIAQPLGIYYKSGFIYDYEVIKVDGAGYKIFNRAMMIDLMKKYIGKVESHIFNDYYDYLVSIKLEESAIKNIIDSDDMDNKNKVIDTYEGQWMLMKKFFEGCSNLYLWNGTSFGRPWTQCIILEQFEKQELCDSLFYRLDWRNDGYYLSIRQYLDYKTDSCKQYLNETDESAIINDKAKRLERLKRCFNETLEEMKQKGIEVLETGKISNRGLKENEFGVFFIEGDNTFSKMIKFFPVFNKTFEEKIQKEFMFTL